MCWGWGWAGAGAGAAPHSDIYDIYICIFIGEEGRRGNSGEEGEEGEGRGGQIMRKKTLMISVKLYIINLIYIYMYIDGLVGGLVGRENVGGLVGE